MASHATVLGLRTGWLSYAPGWPSYAPVRGLCADLCEKRPEYVKVMKFHSFSFMGCSKLLQIVEKTMLYVFCLSTPLDRRFMLCRASQTIDIEKIYRLVSKILNFMACGSVLGHFCVQCKNFVGSASKIYRNSIEILSKLYRNYIEILSKFC